MATTVTMDDIAARVGVSRAAVSLALRRSPKISAARAEEILRVARELGYFPNVNASRLARGGQTSFGVLLADLHNPIMAEILDGFAPAGADEEPDIYLASGFNDAARERASVQSFLAHRVAGIVLVGSKLEAPQIREIAEAVPTVAVGRNVPGVDCVLSDSHLGGRLVADHFLKLGHRSAAHLDGGGGAGAEERKQAFLRRFRSVKGATAITLPGQYTQASGFEAAKTLFASDSGATAVFAANDLMALGALEAAREMGKIAGADFALCGYDDIEMAAYGFISLTSVSYSRNEGGRVARELLQARCADPRRPTRNHESEASPRGSRHVLPGPGGRAEALSKRGGLPSQHAARNRSLTLRRQCRAMVVRTRFRSVLIPLFFYLAAGAASTFLVWGASNGERGLAAKAAYEAQNEELQQELAGLQQERQRWEHRVNSMRSESVDRDLLEEEAHSRLDRVYKDEVVIFTGDKRASP